ncbi:NAD(P)/FAD-dependent oxidoreductase [Aliidiomarina sp. Khilg15.8]
MSSHAAYDPLTAASIDAGYADQVASYWQQQSAPLKLPAAPALPQRAAVVIIGAGYTGLNAALALASEYEQPAVVLEAGDIGAGCSGRNAGFVLPGSGRLSIHDYQHKFGSSTAGAVAAEFDASVNHVRALVQQHNIDCQWQDARLLRVAHTRRHAARLQAQLTNIAAADNAARQYLTQSDLAHQVPGIRQAYGAIQQSPAAAINPRALVQGYASAAANAGASIYTRCPVTRWRSMPAGEQLSTPQGEIVADQVLVCSNAYTPAGLNRNISQRQLPALSSVIVTAPLSEAQVQALGLHSSDLIMDTRSLKYYYRLLPDNRLLFGGRGAVSGKQATHPKYKQHLARAMVDTLPALAKTPIEYYWYGWVSVARDSMPRVFAHSERSFVAMGYCGAGIAFSSLAGKRLAALSQGQTLPPLPFYQSALPAFPNARLRRLGQAAYYQYARIQDWF